MKDVMIDIETFGVNAGAVIVQVAGIYFDRETGELGDDFIRNMDIQQSLNAGFIAEGSTLEWWFNRPQEQVTFLDIYGGGFDIKENFSDFNDFLRGAKNVWCHATFDAPHVTNAMNKLGIKPSFHFTSVRDIRTLQHLANIPRAKTNQKGTHNALDDCRYQVEYCVPYLKNV